MFCAGKQENSQKENELTDFTGSHQHGIYMFVQSEIDAGHIKPIKSHKLSTYLTNKGHFQSSIMPKFCERERKTDRERNGLQKICIEFAFQKAGYCKISLPEHQQNQKVICRFPLKLQ